MKISTNEWLKSAFDDLETIRKIIRSKHLTNIVAFHAQQCVEKCFKAIIEECLTEPQKTHNLYRLHELVKPFIKNLVIDLEMLEKLNELYIDSRYPSDLGLLPNGKPSVNEAKDFFDFANQFYIDINKLLST